MSAINFPTPPRYKQPPNLGSARQGMLTRMARVAGQRASELTGRSVNHMGYAKRDREAASHCAGDTAQDAGVWWSRVSSAGRGLI